MTKEKTKDMKRVTFRANELTVQRLETMAERYGMSVNALCGYIVGKWLDDNFNLQEKMLDTMTKQMSQQMTLSTEKTFEKMIENPQVREQLIEFMKWGAKVALTEERAE